MPGTFADAFKAFRKSGGEQAVRLNLTVRRTSTISTAPERRHSRHAIHSMNGSNPSDGDEPAYLADAIWPALAI